MMKVSVLMVTYNHEQFIAQAVESVLAQETSFDYELVIGEDCSTDGTRAILVGLQQQHPDKVRLLLNENNLGMHKNLAQTLLACRGEYVAMLDGDDYWTSPHKLQREVDFLDGHPECALCFHNVASVHDKGGDQELLVWRPPNQKEISTIEELLLGDFMAACSVMFRRQLIPEYPDWFYSLPIGDWPLWILIAEHGKIGYLDETMAAYRIHQAGVWSSKSPVQRTEADAQVYECVNLHLGFRYNSIIRRRLFAKYYHLAAAYEERGDLTSARRYARRCIRNYSFGHQSLKWLLFAALLIVPIPGLLGLARKLKDRGHSFRRRAKVAPG